jgi:UDPglucose 6-dehydrogenase
MYKEKIGIVGLGKLGLPMMAAFISRGFDVFGYDINQNLIETLRSSINPYKEPGLQEIIDQTPDWNARFIDSLEDLISKVDFLFLIVPTPTKGKIFDVSYLNKAIESISDICNKNKKKLTCVVTSTVNPGDCDQIQAKFYDKNHTKISFVYSPEFIALGSVFKDMLHPDVVLLGGEDQDAIDKIFSIYSRLYKTYPEFHRLNFFEAETAKIAINTFITTKISYANTIGTFIDRATGSRESAQRVLNAVGGDTRIGRKYFKYGASYGGPCFPRDNRALGYHLEKYKVSAAIPEATDAFNHKLTDYWIEFIQEKKYDAIILVGLAYKFGTDFMEESFMIKLGEGAKEHADIYFSDGLIKSCEPFLKLNEFELKNSKFQKYKKILVLKNYGEIDVKDLTNAEVINLWS